MNQKVKNILHDLSKYRDQINCCYECIVHDLRSGEQPQKDDIDELNAVSLEFVGLTKLLTHELRKGIQDEVRE